MNDSSNGILEMANLISEKVYLGLKSDLNNAVILNDEKIFPEPQLSKRYAVSIGTIRKAIGRLVDEGVLERQQGRGTFLANTNLTQHTISSTSIETFANTTRFKYANAYNLHCQDDINRQLWGEHQKQIDSVILPESRQMTELSDSVSNCDIVFYSPLQLTEINQRYLQPVPQWLKEKIELDFSQQACDEFSSLASGELLAIPLIANPTICYLDKRTFKQANIPLPAHDWTWDDFLDICRTLKKSGQMPMTLCPAPGCLFEPLLFQAGTNYFDSNGNVDLNKDSLAEAIKFLRTLIEEELCVNVYNLPQSFPRFIAQGGSCITFCGPLIGGNLPAAQRKHWTFHHLPRNKFQGSTAAFFGLGVSANSQHPEKAWKFIDKVLYGGGFERCASLTGVYPAKISSQIDWKADDLENPQILHETLKYSQPLHSKKGFREVYHDVYEVFNKLIKNKLTIEKGTKELVSILTKNKKETYHFFN
jgi:ABC-type glycerol-3-phosphate transport system substrate-binding protein/DNA-binding transcriptional regulator YhcF (GntR family)